MPSDALVRELEEAAVRLADARTNLVDVMTRARAAGFSYRDIADRVGISHETVRAMLSRQES